MAIEIKKSEFRKLQEFVLARKTIIKCNAVIMSSWGNLSSFNTKY